MQLHARKPSDRLYRKFLDLFVRSGLGVIAVGVPEGTSGQIKSTSEKPIHLGQTSYGDGKRRVLAFADPQEFVRNFGQPFNAELKGADLLEMVVENRECDGILVNSAIAEESILISRGTAVRLAAQASGPAQRGVKTRNEWWRRLLGRGRSGGDTP